MPRRLLSLTMWKLRDKDVGVICVYCVMVDGFLLMLITTFINS